MGATVQLPVTVTAGRAQGPGLDLSALSPVALRDGPAQLFARPADLRVAPDADGPWRVQTLASTGADLRLTVTHPQGAEAEIQMPRRGAPALTRGASVTLQAQAATIFADAPLHKETA